jgi:UDP-N-acetylmuramate dehydrogenase
VNVGDAKAEEMLALIKKAKSTVKDKFDIEMNLEVKLMGFEEREIESL